MKDVIARLSAVGRPSTAAGLARELRWNLAPRRLASLPPSWHLEEARLAETYVIWPGRYGWPAAASWVEPIRLGMEGRVRVRRSEATSQLRDAVAFDVQRGPTTLRAVIDYGDATTIAEGLVGNFDVIFKMQYLRGGYGDERVVPGGFVTNSMSIYRYLPHLRSLRATAAPTADVYGRFGGDKAQEVRARAIELLESQQRLRFRGGIGRVRYTYSLREAALAKVCLDLPGRGPLCFRLVDYLALGARIVSPPHEAEFHVPLEEGRHIVYCAPDLSDLVEVVAELAGDEQRLSGLQREAQSYFDRFLHYRQLGAYYLFTCLERL